MKKVNRFLALALSFTLACTNVAHADWTHTGGHWKYTDPSGKFVTGWMTTGDNHWYYLNSDGIMQTGWLQQGSGWFYLNRGGEGVEGEMRHGWYFDSSSGKWYFLNTVLGSEFGKMLASKWEWIDGYCYYFGSSGEMYANRTTDDGYTVNGDGRYTVNGQPVYDASKGISSKLSKPAKSTTTTTRSGGGGGSSRGGGSSSGTTQSAFRTRGAWVASLVDLVGIQPAEVSALDDFYSDVSSSNDQGKKILIARTLGILPTLDQDLVVNFAPNDPVTREFAAMTVINAMQYRETAADPAFCSDFSSLAHPFHANIAIKFGFLSLKSGNRFAPGDTLTAAEAEQMLNKMKEIQRADAAIGSNPHQIIDYDDEAIAEQIKEEKNYSITDLGGGRYRVELPSNANTALIQAGKIFVLPAKNENLPAVPLKAETVVESGGNLQIEVSAPELSQVYDRISVEGSSNKVAPENIQTIEGVNAVFKSANGQTINIADTVNPHYVPEDEATIDTQFSMQNILQEINIDADIASPSSADEDVWLQDSPLTYTPAEGEVEFSVEGVPVGQYAKLSGKVTVDIPKVNTKVDIDVLAGLKIKEASFTIENGMEIEGGVELQRLNPDGEQEDISGAKEFGRIRIPITGPFSADIVFYFVYSVSGEVKVVYQLETENGLQYKDGSLRFINDLKRNNLEFKDLSAEAKIGGRLGFNLAFNYGFGEADIIGTAIDVGPAIKAEVTERPLYNPPFTCFDATIYLFLEMSINDETALGKLLKENSIINIDTTMKIWTDENSPLKHNWHFEKLAGQALKKVDKCLHGEGKLTGRITDAETGEAIRNAKVVVYLRDRRERIVYSNANGEYAIPGLNANTYLFRVSANGYTPYNIDRLDVSGDEDGTVKQAEMLKVGSMAAANGSIHGRFINSDNGYNVNNVQYTVYKGWNVTSGEAVTSGSASGEFRISLAPGNYTIATRVSGFVTSYESFTIVGGREIEENVTIAPSDGVDNDRYLDGDLKVVLRWGALPRDLDSHLFGPGINGGHFHTYFANRTYRHNNARIADLDLDDTTSYGPETTTVYRKLGRGVYHFYVHDYTNRNATDSNKLSNSGAYLRVYTKSGVREIRIPKNKVGTVWHAFDYDAATGRITVPNTFHNSNDTSRLGVNYSYTDALADVDMLNEQMMLDMIGQASAGEKEE